MEPAKVGPYGWTSTGYPRAQGPVTLTPLVRPFPRGRWNVETHERDRRRGGAAKGAHGRPGGIRDLRRALLAAHRPFRLEHDRKCVASEYDNGRGRRRGAQVSRATRRSRGALAVSARAATRTRSAPLQRGGRGVGRFQGAQSAQPARPRRVPAARRRAAFAPGG